MVLVGSYYNLRMSTHISNGFEMRRCLNATQFFEGSYSKSLSLPHLSWVMGYSTNVLME